MSPSFTVDRPFHVSTGRRSRKEVRGGEASPAPPSGRIPRISRLMALAIRFDGLLTDGVIADRAELARVGQVSRARISQIMCLLDLAPDIQETLLFLPRVECGREPIQLRHVLPVAGVLDWGEQRRLWRKIES